MCPDADPGDGTLQSTVGSWICWSFGLVGWDGVFLFSVTLASVLLARLCKAGVNLATAGQGRRQFLSCEVDGRGPCLFAAISDQCVRG